MREVFFDNKGLSLPEVLIALGIITVLNLAIVSIINSARLEQRAIDEKLESLSLKTALVSALTNQETCTAFLMQNPQVLNLSAVTTAIPLPVPIPFNKLEIGTGLGASLLAKTGEPLPGQPPNRMIVKEMAIKNLLASGTPNRYFGSVEVTFESTSLVRPLRIIHIPNLNVTVEPDVGMGLAAATLKECSLQPILSVKNCTWEGTWIYHDASVSNDFGVTCRDGVITGFCGNADPDPGDVPPGLHLNCYMCEGNSFAKWTGSCP